MHTEGHPPWQEPMEECHPKTGQRNRSGSLWIKIWVMILHCPWTWPPSWWGTAKEWDNTPSPSIPLSVDPQQLLCSGSHQHHPINTGGACPKVPVPSGTGHSQLPSWIKGIPDVVDHPDQWIKAEMDRLERHPHWWKETWDDLNKPEALYVSQWQAVAFRLPLT